MSESRGTRRQESSSTKNKGASIRAKSAKTKEKSPKEKEDTRKRKAPNKKQSIPSSTSKREKSPTIEEEKAEKKPNSHYSKFSDKVVFKYDDDDEYLRSFLKKADDYHCQCIICDTTFTAGYALTHIQLPCHLNKTEEKQPENIEKLLRIIEKIPKPSENNNKAQKTFTKESETSNYLKFLSFALAEKLSFCQISKIGNFLKELSKEHALGLSFFKNQSFDRELVANIATDCFRPCLIQNLKDTLLKTNFSFSMDTTTMAGSNICALKVRFLQKEYDPDYQQEITEIKNKLIGITKLTDSSCAYTMLDIVKKKLFFDDNKEIQSNLVGFVHDRGSNFNGIDNGLSVLLQKELQISLFNLCDPCHSIDLIIKHSLPSIPLQVRNFITNIHSYFTSPQRKEILKKIQEKNNLNVLNLRHYVKTRWGSLGDSLTRLSDIWPSLVKYMDSMTASSVKPKKTYEDTELSNIDYINTHTLLIDEVFQIKIQFLSTIINRLNTFTRSFQN